MSRTRPMHDSDLCIVMHPAYMEEVVLMLTALNGMSVEDREQTLILMKWSVDHCMIGSWATVQSHLLDPPPKRQQIAQEAHILGQAI